MIEKLDLDCGYATVDWLPTQHGKRCGAKEIQTTVNQLVDAVNELQLTVSKMENLEHLKKIGQGFKNLQDPYAEQRKWAGKLCWFWEDDPNDKIVDVLSHIDTARICPFIQCDHQVGWSNCEPVKPTDDIIYKKEQQ